MQSWIHCDALDPKLHLCCSAGQNGWTDIGHVCEKQAVICAEWDSPCCSAGRGAWGLVSGMCTKGQAVICTGCTSGSRHSAGVQMGLQVLGRSCERDTLRAGLATEHQASRVKEYSKLCYPADGVQMEVQGAQRSV